MKNNSCKNLNAGLLLLSIFSLSFLIPAKALSNFDQDSLRKPPIGRYMLIRPCIIKGSVISIGRYKAKIAVEKWIKGTKNQKKISVIHTNSFEDIINRTNNIEHLKNQSYIFILRGWKAHKNRRLLLWNGIGFKVENDSIHIPKEYFAMTRNIDESTRALSNTLKKEGIRISLAYFEWLVDTINERYISEKHKYERCFKYVEKQITLDPFATLIINDLKSEICRYSH